ncbi:MAG TPA: alkaline phosphatase, partial [Candidatus Sumerlaeota bacterium]|nr:alkaline phosphatase [Candidatus Sumerlaeota bacterium]
DGDAHQRQSRHAAERHQAVKTALDFAAKDGKTLVLVTADHETGGMAIEEEKKELSFDWTSRDHTGTPVPVFACGPGAIKFTGVMNNTDIPKKIGEILGLKNFPQKAE